MQIYVMVIMLVSMEATCWVTWGEVIKTPYSTGSSCRSLSIAYFCSFQWLFWFVGLWLVLVSLLISVLVCWFWTCIWNIWRRWSLCLHIVWFVIMWSQPHVLVASLYSCWWSWKLLDWELSLLLKFFFIDPWHFIIFGLDLLRDLHTPKLFLCIS